MAGAVLERKVAKVLLEKSFYDVLESGWLFGREDGVFVDLIGWVFLG